MLKKYPPHAVEFIWFSDEKLFTVAAPSNPQNDRLYVVFFEETRSQCILVAAYETDLQQVGNGVCRHVVNGVLTDPLPGARSETQW